MKRRSYWRQISALICVLTSSVLCETQSTPENATVPEQRITIIPIAGDELLENAELSGLAWYRDWLVLLPQYPDRFAEGDGAVLAIRKDDIFAFLNGERSDPLVPRIVPFIAPLIAELVEGFDGFEAIAFADDQVFLTIEIDGDDGMSSYLVSGSIAPNLSQLVVNVESLVHLACPAMVHNIAYEVLTVVKDTVVTFFEANGREITQSPYGLRYSRQLEPLPPISLANIEYRITDATCIGAEGRFWVINYHWHGEEQLAAAADPIAERFGVGDTHAASHCVERLLELQYTPEGIYPTEAAPIYLRLLPDDICRNWEGIVKVDERGFLLVTDKFPETLLAFVKMPKR
jgi:hypothetical protein